MKYYHIMQLSSCQIGEFLKLKFIGDEKAHACRANHMHPYMHAWAFITTLCIDLYYLLNRLNFLSRSLEGQHNSKRDR